MQNIETAMLIDKIKQFPLGYSEVYYQNKKYGVSRSEFNQGKSIKLYAKELAGDDFISLNIYSTSTAEILKPCEMPEYKVIDFINNFRPII